METMKIFKNHKVEVFQWKDVILFNPYDVGVCLDISDDGIRKAMTRMNENQVIKLTNSNVTNSHFRKLHNTGENFLTESGVYKLIFKSRKPEAEEFQCWVTDVVLPSIRKHGVYATEELLDNPDFLIKVLIELKESRKNTELLNQKNLILQKEIEEDRPKVLFAESVSNSDDLMLIRGLAKLIKQNGVDIGEKRLYAWLRKENYLISKKGSDYNMPTQKSMDLGLFKVVEGVINSNNGFIMTTRTTKVTGKGQEYFINKFIKMKEEMQVLNM